VLVYQSVDTWYLTRADYEADAVQFDWINDRSNHAPLIADSHPYSVRFFLEDVGPNSVRGSKKLLTFNCAWGFPRSTFAGFPLSLLDGMVSWMQNALHLKPDLFQLAQRIVRQLPKHFLAIHWREGDFNENEFRTTLDTEHVVSYFRDVCGVRKDENYMMYIGQKDNVACPEHKRCQCSCTHGLTLQTVCALS
jgi:hypothetical protein